MRRSVSALALLLGLAPVHADEGMWMPSQLPDIAGSLKAAGFLGDPKALAELASPPMNAVVKAGGGTGAFVSGQGLLLTNHHVAYGVIQYNSRPDRDLLGKGFIAADRAAELPANPDFRVLVTTGFDRVTDSILKPARGKQGRAYFEAIEAAGKALVADCERDGLRCSVANMYYGTDFYLVRQLELRDIRLVYAPPEAIGSYGDEIDNFMWPRHSGDFTLLRAYVGRDGKPADYAADNIPYMPAAHLQVSTADVSEGDFAMLAGYPGVTFRHRMAAEFKRQVEWQLPSRVALYATLISTVQKAVEGNEETRVRYASQMAGFQNMLKRAQGEWDGLRRSDAVAVRAADEAAMMDWLSRQPRASKSTRADITSVQGVLDAAAATRERDQLIDAMRKHTQLLRSALTLQRLALEKPKPDAQRESGFQQRDLGLIAGQLKQVQRRYDPAVEQAVLAELLRQYLALPASQRVAEFDQVFGTDPQQIPQRLERLYAATRLDDETQRLQWMQADVAALAAAKDGLLDAAATLTPALLRMDEAAKERDGELLRLRPAYMRALIGYRQSQGRAVYPDANGTLRVSFGKVTALDPRDGVHYAPVTTVRGIVEKDTGKAPFDAPKPLIAAIARGDFGSTADASLKTQTVNLLTNLDTTGGNSGSPVLGADGRLIGLNFDSNWEAVSASWMFDPRYKRAIHVDMRYMRWLMAKVYPAPHLLDEMALPLE